MEPKDSSYTSTKDLIASIRKADKELKKRNAPNAKLTSIRISTNMNGDSIISSFYSNEEE